MPNKRSGRPHTRSDRETTLSKLWGKLARSTYAMIEYDLYSRKELHAYITKEESKKLKKACTDAIDAIFEEYGKN